MWAGEIQHERREGWPPSTASMFVWKLKYFVSSWPKHLYGTYLGQGNDFGCRSTPSPGASFVLSGLQRQTRTIRKGQSISFGKTFLTECMGCQNKILARPWNQGSQWFESYRDFQSEQIMWPRGSLTISRQINYFKLSCCSRKEVDRNKRCDGFHLLYIFAIFNKPREIRQHGGPWRGRNFCGSACSCGFSRSLIRSLVSPLLNDPTPGTVSFVSRNDWWTGSEVQKGHIQISQNWTDSVWKRNINQT